MTALHDPIPGFVRAGRIVREASAALRPPKKTTVSEWAEQSRQLRNPGGYSGPWRNASTPMWVEPMDRLSSRSVDQVVIVAGSQTGKTEIGLNWIGHSIECSPADMMVVQYSRDMAIEFAGDRVDRKLIAVSPSLSARLGSSRSEQKILEKRFSSGMRVIAGWPVPGQLASRPLSRVWIDERDRMPDDIGGEGAPEKLAKNRTETFGRNAMVLVTSTPSRDMHHGIVGLWAQGDQCLWAWPCPECGEYFTPGFDENRDPTTEHLWFPEKADRFQARAEARLLCPHCGSLIEETQKTGMNARGVWLPQGMEIDRDGRMSGQRVAASTASYWACGLASPFKEWGTLAHDLVSARAKLDETQDDTSLKAVINTGFGFPYRSPSDDAEPLEWAHLKARAEDWQRGTVPDGVRFLTASVDVQIDRFACQVVGWGDEFESWLIDRWDLKNLEPAVYGEHWDLLIPQVLRRVFPLADDPAHGLPVAALAVDSQGVPGVTDQAKAFHRRARAMGVPDWQLTLINGASRPNAPAIGRPAFEVDNNGRKLPDSAKIRTIGVHVLKNVVDVRLRKEDPGPGFMHFPADLPDRVFAEITNERKENGLWVKKGPNETFDLTVYAFVQMMLLRSDRVNWARPPFWARPVEIRDGSTVEDGGFVIAPGEATPVRGSRPARRGVRSRGIRS